MSVTKQAQAATAPMQLITGWLAGIRKEAATKLATDPTPSTGNPVMSAPDGTQPAKEGERGRENDADVKAELGENANVGETPVNSDTAGKKPTDDMGTMMQDADANKGNVPTPKPAPDATNATVFQEPKSASLAKQAKSLLSIFDVPAGTQKAATAVSDQGGAVTKVTNPPVAANAAPAGDKQTPPEKAMDDMATKRASAQKHTAEAELGYAAGLELMEALGMIQPAAEKQAATQKIAEVIMNAERSATRVCQFKEQYANGLKIAALAQRTKKAEPEIAAMTGAVPPEGPGAGMPVGGGDMGMGGAGGPPPEMGGGGMGGPPPEVGAAGGMGGDPMNEKVLDAIAQALESGQVTADDLIAALQSSAGGGGGGDMGGGAGGPPPMGGGDGGGADMPPKKEEGGEKAPEKKETQKEEKADTGEDGGKEAGLRKRAAARTLASFILAGVQAVNTNKAASLATFVRSHLSK